MTYVLGVDLGTTYSSAAIAVGDRCEIAQLGAESASIPSVVHLRADGEVLVGEPAARRAATEPGRTIREFKRRLGDPTPMIVGGTPFGAEALTAHLLRSIVAQVSAEQGGPPALIAVTHPASHGEYKRDLLRQAVRQAGVSEAVFLAEPVAAALYYASEERVAADSVTAVYDFGGGTFDAAVLRKLPGDDGFEILGRPEGLDRLGGADFDEAVFAHVAELVGPANLAGDGSPAARSALARLRDECREAKEALSSDTEATIPVSLPTMQTEVRLTRSELEDIVRPRIGETVDALERAVHSAGLTLDGIDRILLVGGTSRMPLIGQLVAERTGRPIFRDSHPRHAVALGAALFAASRSGAVPAGPAASSAPVAPLGLPVTSVPTAIGGPPHAEAHAEASAAAPERTTALPGRPFTMPPPPTSEAAPTRRPRWLPWAAAAALILVVVGGAAALLLGGGDASAQGTARITDVAVASGNYQVKFETSGFAPSETGQRLHFFWNTVAPSDAGEPGAGPWTAYWGSSPVAVAPLSQKPSGATQLCVLVANAQSKVRSGSGNCWALPR